MGKHSIALAMFCGLVFGIGCAQGTDNTTSGDDAITNPDAMDNPAHIDAHPLAIDANPLPIDASPLPIDASPLPIDAAPSGGLDIGEDCTASSQCSSNCCFAIGVCFADPGFPGACL